MLEYRPGELKRVQDTALQVLKEFIRICDKYQLDYFVHWGTALGAVRHQGFIPWDDDVDVAMLRGDYERFLQVAPRELEGRYELSSAFIQKNCAGMFTKMSAAGTLHVTEQESLWPGLHGIRVDIFPFDNVPEDEKKRRKQERRVRFYNMLYVVKNLPHPYIQGNSIKTKMVKTASFLAHCLMKPVPVDWILRQAEKYALLYKEQTKTYTLLYDLYPEQWLLKWEDIYPLQEGTFEGLQVKLLHHNDLALRNSYGNYMELPPEEERVNHYSGRLKFNEDDN